MSEAFYIIDGHAYSYQAFYGLSTLFSPDGKPTNAIYGFLRMIYKLLDEKQPQYLAVCFDLPSPVFRNQIFEAYKANRKEMPEDMRSQISTIKEVLKAHPICVLEKEGFEADDIMATLAKKASAKGIDVYLVTPDKDIAQVLQEGIKIFDLKKNLVLDARAIEEKYTIPASKLPDYFALTGDKIDNIPGVNGIGPKKAAQLIQEWQSLEHLYENLDKIEPEKVRKTLEKYKEDAFMSKKLFLVQDDMPILFELEDYRVQKRNIEKLLPLYRQLGFFSFLSEILEKNPIQKDAFARKIENQEALCQLVSELNQQESIILAIEDNSESLCWSKKIYSIGFLWGEKAAYIEFDDIQLNQKKVLEILYPILFQGPKKSGYNLKSIYTSFAIQGIFLMPLGFDISMASYLLENSEKTLEHLSLQYLGESMNFSKENKSECWGMHLNLLKKLEKKLSELLSERRLDPIFYECEIPLIPILSEMERFGILVSRQNLEIILQEFREKSYNLEQKIFQLAGESFAIKSLKQLAYILFEKLQLPKSKKTKTGYSVSIPILEDLKKYHEMPGMILEYKELEKIKDFYSEKFPYMLHLETSRIHPQYFQNKHSSGKIVSSLPDMEKIEKEVSVCCIASPEHIFVKASYNQPELRILAQFSHSEPLLEAIEKNIVVPKDDLYLWIQEHACEYKEVQEFFDESIQKLEKERYLTMITGRTCYAHDIISSQKDLKRNSQEAHWKALLEGSLWDILKRAILRIDQKREESMFSFFFFASITNALIFEVLECEKEKFIGLVRKEMQEAALSFLPLPVDITSGKCWQDFFQKST
ncbi:MAG: hypothetical protein HUU50_09665 [Candidatus Brocadiae bacterium]|nr:hypothetical protein [Candidatus Brocadiia bacterium]